MIQKMRRHTGIGRLFRLGEPESATAERSSSGWFLAGREIMSFRMPLMLLVALSVIGLVNCRGAVLCGTAFFWNDLAATACAIETAEPTTLPASADAPSQPISIDVPAEEGSRPLGVPERTEPETPGMVLRTVPGFERLAGPANQALAPPRA